MDDLQDTVCGMSVPMPVPCPHQQAVWWKETPGAAWGEAPAQSILDEDGSRLYTAATISGTHDGGSGCLVSATDTETGLPFWETVIPAMARCGLVNALELDPLTGDVLLLGYDWGSTHEGSVYRLDHLTGVIRWSHTGLDETYWSLAVNPEDEQIFVSVAYREGHEIEDVAILPLDIHTGLPADPIAIVPPGWEIYFVIDMAYDPGHRQLLLSGGAELPDPSSPGETLTKATVMGIGLDGAIQWTAHDPTPGYSFGFGMDHAAETHRAFMASKNGITTVDTRNGDVLGLASLSNGETWSDVVFYYDVAYDGRTDTAVMTASRDYEDDESAYAAVAARGSDGSRRWDRDIAPSTSYSIVAAPAFDANGDVLVTGTTVDYSTGVRTFQAILARLDAATGEKMEHMDVARLPETDTFAHYVAPLGGTEVVVGGMVRYEEIRSTFEARIDLS